MTGPQVKEEKLVRKALLHIRSLWLSRIAAMPNGNCAMLASRMADLEVDAAEASLRVERLKLQAAEVGVDAAREQVQLAELDRDDAVTRRDLLADPSDTSEDSTSASLSPSSALATKRRRTTSSPLALNDVVQAQEGRLATLLAQEQSAAEDVEAARGRLRDLKQQVQQRQRLKRDTSLQTTDPRNTEGSGASQQEPAEVVSLALDIPELDLKDLSEARPPADQDVKAATLARVRQKGVRQITGLSCHRDPAWALNMLRSAAPTLEKLTVLQLREEHLWMVHAMPRLRRLCISCDDGALDKHPPILAALPVGSLEWLRVYRLPMHTLVSLLQAHSDTLDVLWLAVGTRGRWEWPMCCSNVEELLAECGLRLSRMVLWRYMSHKPAACRAQLALVRGVLPSTTTVQCNVCDAVPWDEF